MASDLRRPDVIARNAPAGEAAASGPLVLKPLPSFDEETDTERIDYPPPADGWAEPQFDDGDWPRNRFPVAPGGGHMGPFHVSSGVLSVRGKFPRR